MGHALWRVSCPHADGDFNVDLLVDDKGNAARMFPTFGWWGRLKSNDLLPFVLTATGAMDFGAVPDDEIGPRGDRYGQTDILERAIFDGREVVFVVDGYTYNTMIKTISVLLGVGPSAILRP